MKRVDWPRPPLLLGLVLGGLLERYMFISFQRYGAEWLTRPIVVVVLLVTAYSLLKPVASDLMRRRRQARSRLVLGFKPESIDAAAGFNAAVILFFAVAIIGSWSWDFGARLVPQVVGWLGLLLAGWQLAWRALVNAPPAAPGDSAAGAVAGSRVFDARSDLGDLDPHEARRRALRYFGWCLFILVAALIIGLLPAMLVFLVGYLRFEGRERWLPTLSVALGTWAAAYGLFHLLLRVPWPTAWLGDLLPVLRSSGLTNLL